MNLVSNEKILENPLYDISSATINDFNPSIYHAVAKNPTLPSAVALHILATGESRYNVPGDELKNIEYIFKNPDFFEDICKIKVTYPNISGDFADIIVTNALIHTAYFSNMSLADFERKIRTIPIQEDGLIASLLKNQYLGKDQFDYLLDKVLGGPVETITEDLIVSIVTNINLDKTLFEVIVEKNYYKKLQILGCLDKKSLTTDNDEMPPHFAANDEDLFIPTVARKSLPWEVYSSYRIREAEYLLSNNTTKFWRLQHILDELISVPANRALPKGLLGSVVENSRDFSLQDFVDKINRRYYAGKSDLATKEIVNLLLSHKKAETMITVLRNNTSIDTEIADYVYSKFSIEGFKKICDLALDERTIKSCENVYDEVWGILVKSEQLSNHNKIELLDFYINNTQFNYGHAYANYRDFELREDFMLSIINWDLQLEQIELELLSSSEAFIDLLCSEKYIRTETMYYIGSLGEKKLAYLLNSPYLTSDRRELLKNIIEESYAAPLHVESFYATSMLTYPRIEEKSWAFKKFIAREKELLLEDTPKLTAILNTLGKDGASVFWKMLADEDMTVHNSITMSQLANTPPKAKKTGMLI